MTARIGCGRRDDHVGRPDRLRRQARDGVFVPAAVLTVDETEDEVLIAGVVGTFEEEDDTASEEEK